jgi:hypothetical protein
MPNRHDQRHQTIEAVVAVDVWMDGPRASAPRRPVDEPGVAGPPERTAPVVLSAEEAQLLGRILGSYLGDLRMEIAGTDNAAMRRELHGEEDAIRRLLARLPAS